MHNLTLHKMLARLTNENEYFVTQNVGGLFRSSYFLINARNYFNHPGLIVSRPHLLAMKLRALSNVGGI